MKARKRLVIMMCIIIAVAFVLVQITVNSQTYLEWRIQQTKQNMAALITEDELELHELAASISEESKEIDYDLWKDIYRSNFSQELDSRTDSFLESSKVKFDSIFVYSEMHAVYPDGCCVFRVAIEYHRGVYAWVELVYSPTIDERVPNWYKASEQVAPDWFIHVLYGY